MSKKSEKKPKRSAKPGAKASSAEKSPKEAPLPPVKIPKPKKPGIFCGICNKPMKDEKTRKLHERHCKPKPEAPAKSEKDLFESAIVELKDRFNDEVQSMSKTLQEREEHHQRELDEVRTVLRMEIDHHRKELERISKVEKEVAAEKLSHHEEPQAHEVPPPSEPVPIEPEPQPTARVPDGRPKAIDMLPLPLPTIPKKRYQPLPEQEFIPDLDHEEAAPVPAETHHGLEREEVEAMVRDIMKTAPQPAPTVGNIGGIAEKIERLDTRIEKNVSDLRKAMDRIASDDTLKRFEKDLARVTERVQDIMEDSGYGESLSVAKIPPTILEIVYQAILDDIHIEIIKTKGPQDAERFARSALEEVRLKTSGSELFKFDGRKIVTDSLARSIEANLISARQIQTTYDVLLDKLLETVPHYKAKNFKGMIKIKSQEFAVDKATKLTKEFLRFEKVMESTNQMVAAMAANFNSRNLELHETVNEMKNNTLATKADREEIESLRSKVEAANERISALSNELSLLKAELEMKEQMKTPDTIQPEGAEDMIMAPGEMPGGTEDGTAEPASDAQAGTEETDEKIIEAIRGGSGTKTAIVKATGLEEPEVKDAIARLVEQRKIIEKKSGKRSKYTTLDRELEEKLVEFPAEEPGKKPKKGGKKRKASESGDEFAEPTPIPEPEPIAPATEPVPPGPAIQEQEPVQVAPDEPPEPTPEPAPAAPEIQEPEPKEPVESKPARKGKKGKGSKPRAMIVEPVAEPKEPEMPEPSPEEPEPPTAEPVEEKAPTTTDIADDFPVIQKALEDLSEDEKRVLESLSEDGMTVSGIQSKIGKDLKRFALLRALRVLIDSGHVGILTKGRLELYQRINVQKTEKNEREKSKKEVK
jgi:hypothetical protein